MVVLLNIDSLILFLINRLIRNTFLSCADIRMLQDILRCVRNGAIRLNQDVVDVVILDHSMALLRIVCVFDMYLLLDPQQITGVLTETALPLDSLHQVLVYRGAL